MEKSADVIDLDRAETRRYDLHDLKSRLEAEKAAAGSTGGPGQVWFVAAQGRKVGPLTRAGLEGLRARGILAPQTLVWRAGWPLWAAAEAVPELRPLLGLSLELTGSAPREDSLPSIDRANMVAPPLPDAQSLPFEAPAAAAEGAQDQAATGPGDETTEPSSPAPRRAPRTAYQFSAPSSREGPSHRTAIALALVLAAAGVVVLAVTWAPLSPATAGARP